MGLTSAVHWWEESQLRVLVLGSLVVQWLLFLSSMGRRRAIPGWFRSTIWLAYLGSDALAIYALAALFNRHKNQDRGSSSILEVVWTPILLIHLGGQDTITAYNIEDNELWRRHIFTSVSQVTVSIYVFIKSWPGGDKRLLQTAILLFVVGVLKCLDKPLAFKRASINSLVSSSELIQRTKNKGKIISLEDYVRGAKAIIDGKDLPSVLEEDDKDLGQGHGQRARNSAQDNTYFLFSIERLQSAFQCWRERGHKEPTAQDNNTHQQHKIGDTLVHGEPYKLFVDLASPYPNRLSTLKSFLEFHENQVHRTLENKLSDTFHLLYTKIKMNPNGYSDEPSWNLITRVSFVCLPFAAIGLFHYSHRKDYNDQDVKITYALICCTAALEGFSSLLLGEEESESDRFEVMVSQYSLIELFAHNKTHTKMMRILSLFGCKDYINQHWCMKSHFSTPRITELVHQHAKAGWKNYIKDDVTRYRMFNALRGKLTLERHHCNHLGWSLDRAFDESVLLWHVVSDFCFYLSSFTEHKCAFDNASKCGGLTCCKAVQCTRMSNYMMHLLYVNPEMLLPGTRQNLFTTAYKELEVILKGEKIPRDESGLTKKIIHELRSPECSKEGFIHDAWVLAEKLLDLGDDKMWEVIEGVWIEMLCFSASRCRGYLHAKALGSGGELLTNVWLLLSCMGMETLAERMQRPEFTRGRGNIDAAPSTSAIRITDTVDPLISEIRIEATSSNFDVHIAAEEDMV
ncbi:hypothetical protein ACP4OV_025224 [Aristida adscensionis]